MFLDRYFAGTISVAANGTTVTGSGTAWVANGVQAGDYLHARGLMIRIAAVVSNTNITLAEGWPGATLSGASYAILYRVDADRYGAGQAQLLSTLASGNLSSLAGLPGNANRLPYFSAQNTMAEAPITAFGRSLLEDANVAAFWATIGATSSPEQAYRRGNIVGTVSQSSGVPTGALAEYGSNANGQFWRFAGGLQISTSGMLEALSVPAGGYTEMTWTYPATFAGTPDVPMSWRSAGTPANVASALAAGCNCSALPGASTAIVVFRNGTGSALTMRASLVAIGRWH